MEVYKYHSNITQKWHGASRNYRYVLDVLASMVVEKLLVVILPSGRVPGRVLLVLPILEAAAAAEQR